MNYDYDIVVETELGERRGSLALREGAEGCFGTLHLLRSDNEVRGEISADGQVRLIGKIHTLLQNIPFTASGRLDAQQIALTLCCGRRELALRGTAKGE